MAVSMVMMVVVAGVVMLTVLPYGFRHWDRFETGLANRIECLMYGFGRSIDGKCSSAQLEAQTAQPGRFANA